MVDKIIGTIFLSLSGILFSVEKDFTIFIVLFTILGFYYLGKERIKTFKK